MAWHQPYDAEQKPSSEASANEVFQGQADFLFWDLNVLAF